jgi:hypothetical protein
LKVGAASPLDDAGILLQVLNILGPGQHIFISAVSNLWRESYEKVDSVQMAGIIADYDDNAVLHTIKLAHECGRTFAHSWQSG